MLSTHQIQRFGNDGYLVLEDLITASEIASLRSAALRIAADFDVERHRHVFSAQSANQKADAYFLDSAESVHCFLEADALDTEGDLTRPKDQSINKIGHALHDHVPEFTAFCRHPRWGTLLRNLGYDSPEIWQTMYIFKPPRIGGEVRWHQDATYLISEPPAVLGIWIALEDATLDNGCLWVEPGGHRSPLREVFEVDSASRSGRLRMLDPTPWPDHAAALPLPIAMGSGVLLHGQLPHFSSRNASERSRHAFSLHVKNATAEWSERNWLQRRTLPRFAI